VSDSAVFTATSDAQGTPAQSWSCALTAASVDSSTATFTTPANCTLTAAPADDCTYQVTFNSITATLSGDSLTAKLSGHLGSTCTSSSNVSEDFSLDTVSVTRQ
jgi:hypothetical protein